MQERRERRLLLNIPDFNLKDLTKHIMGLVTTKNSSKLFAWKIDTVRSYEIFGNKGYASKADIEAEKDLANFSIFPVITLYFGKWHKEIQKFIDDIYFYEEVVKKIKDE